MINEELTRMRGRLAEYKQKSESLGISADQDIITARNLLDPYEPDVTNLKTAEAKMVVDRLHKTVVELKDLIGKIVELEEALK